MKAYVRFIAFTISLGVAFASSYLAQLALDVTGEWWAVTVTACPYVPPARAFEIAVPILRLFVLALLTPSVAVRKFRNAVPLLIILGLLDAGWCYAFSVLKLVYLAIGICVIQLAILFVLTSFFIRNSKALWLITIPIDAMYIAITALTAAVLF